MHPRAHASLSHHPTRRQARYPLSRSERHHRLS
jgi:hypothetical protein